MGVERPVLSWLAVALILVPAPRQWRVRNFTVLSLIAWLFILGVISAINSILWMGHTRIIHVTWCDVAAHVLLAGNFGLPATLLCMSVQLMRVTLFRAAIISTRKWRFFEIFLCWVFPWLMVPIFYIYESHRFGILEDVGCYPGAYVNQYTNIHCVVVPFLLTVASFICACLTLGHFIRQRARIFKYLSDLSPALKTADYIRLLLLTFFQMIGGVTVTSILLWYNYFVVENEPWRSWADVHSDWGSIGQIPKALLRPLERRYLYGLSWNVQITCLCFFVFFVPTKGLVKECKHVRAWFSRVILRRHPPEPPVRVRMAWKPREGALLGTCDTFSTTVVDHISISEPPLADSTQRTKLTPREIRESPVEAALVVDIRLPPPAYRRTGPEKMEA